MKYLNEYSDGSRLSGIYLCKSKITATTKNGRTYYNLVIQDKTGVMDAKVWDVDSGAIEEFEAMDYIDVVGEVSRYNGSLQLTVRRLRIPQEGEYDKNEYQPSSRYSRDSMYENLLKYIGLVENRYYSELLKHFFENDAEFAARFKNASAAKNIHHGFIGGLLEHTLGVVRLCQIYTKAYPFLNKDLLITAGILHDIGKLDELSAFPENDYTDEGQLLGHISIGAEMIHDACAGIEGFPKELEVELKHCILSHHGELEYGSPKKPALAEAVALSMADLTDARMESFREALDANPGNDEWFGFSRIFESNIRRTRGAEE